MTLAPMVTLDLPVSARAAYLVSEYERLKLDSSDLSLLIDGMVRRHGRKITDSWQDFMKQQNWIGLAQSLLTTHYDPAYDQSVSRHGRDEWLRLSQNDCSEEQRERTAHQILSVLDKIYAASEIKP